MQNAEKVQICVQSLKNKFPPSFSPLAGLVLGTGLGDLAGAFEERISVPYADLPGFPLSGVVSHASCFAAGYFAGVPVLAQGGRCHLYEGRTPGEVCMGVRVMAGLGISALIVTNAAGALNPQFNAGGLMLVTDHVNLTGCSSLTGLAQEEGVFIDMGGAYDAAFARLAGEAALRLALRLEKGVYVGVAGPQFETGAETRFYRLIGGDAVGMSSVLEVIAARHLGLRVLALSCLTNKNLPDCTEKADIEDIVRVAGQCGASLERLLRALLPDLAAECGGS
ncbi:MAG: purine-nucleoside phosphorylase [Desulfovibrio sp.]|jgi:purine-nucleoside phosphorylase|nr:purine-nucleoside phosphorylase [Desulfovibrio sp.]